MSSFYIFSNRNSYEWDPNTPPIIQLEDLNMENLLWYLRCKNLENILSCIPFTHVATGNVLSEMRTFDNLRLVKLRLETQIYDYTMHC